MLFWLFFVLILLLGVELLFGSCELLDVVCILVMLLIDVFVKWLLIVKVIFILMLLFIGIFEIGVFSVVILLLKV